MRNIYIYIYIYINIISLSIRCRKILKYKKINIILTFKIEIF